MYTIDQYFLLEITNT